MPRLFSAIEIPRELRLRLAMVRARIFGARWIEVEDMHLTVRFFGDVEPAVARELIERLGDVSVKPFELTLEGLGVFGGGHPRAIWAGIRPERALEQLQQRHERVARQVGLAPEARTYTPHVTLARLKGTRAREVAHFLESYGGFLAAPFQVTRFVLLSSQPGTGGGPYVTEATYGLEDLGGDFEPDEGDWLD